MAMLCEINPTWLILVVNVIAVLLVPFITYRYAHRNNLKTLRERWVSEFRTSTSSYVQACSDLYYANDMRYQKLSLPNTPADSERTSYIKRCDEAQSKVSAAWAKIRLLFKEGDKDFMRLEPLVKTLKDSVDKPAKIGDAFHMEPKLWNDSQDAFLKESNAILTAEWTKIAK